MKLLLCIASLHDVEPALQHFGVQLQKQAAGYMHTAKILQHELDILETGVGVYQTTYKVTRALAQTRYHLALKLSTGNSYKQEIACGTVLNIINEKPGDYGMFSNGEWKDHYDFNLLKREDAPHVRGGFINMTNAYVNVFMPFKKSVGITVNNYADVNSVKLRQEKYKADCETGDGLGFVYPCLFEKQTFYHLCVIERNLVTAQENFHLAQQNLNQLLIDLLQKL